MEGETTLAQDLCARLCHDLVGPLGTVTGALDMLEDDPEAAELARDAATDLRRRLKFWRAACGGISDTLALSELSGLLDGMLAGGRASLALKGMGTEEALPAPVAQMLLVAALLVGDALPRGGVVTLSREGEGLLLHPSGRAVAWPAPLLTVLRGEPALGPREVPAAMLGRLTVASRWRMLVVPHEGEEALILSPAA
ncbi:histidine phosphotransferase family protein [Pseudoroseomonas globiformis]|uniref:Histidine phosphotransferase family protein n=1 Tax=Teichococcus globiformis TaxID=2307229 RepID=A0ABV7G521_9PROT